MKIHEIIDHLENLAPTYLQESYDNAGLLCGDASRSIESALFCLDSTEAVIDEAIERGCGLVVAHHPIIFSGLKRLTGANYIERTLIKAIKNDIAIYSIHTNLDNVDAGVNRKMGERIGLKRMQILAPKAGNTIEHAGSGMVGFLVEPKAEVDMLLQLKNCFHCEAIRHTALLGKPVKKVAICGGSGSFLLPQAIEQNCDMFITADYKYHQFFDAENRILIADIGHYESEQFTPELLVEYLREKFPTFALLLSEVNTNPVNYI